MKFGELIDQAIECIKSYNPVYKTVDSHADEFLSSVKDPYEKVFIKQVFYGCIRYEEFLKIFTKVFYQINGSLNRNDMVMYSIFAYLSFFRLDELQIGDFKKLIQSQEAHKMNTFLSFAFNSETLRQNLREPWLAAYDFEYIDNKVIGGVEKNLPAVTEIIRYVERKATGKVTTALSQSSSQLNKDEDAEGGQSQIGMSATHSVLNQSGSPADVDQKVKLCTVPQPFNLTKIKPKMIPLPQAIKREVHAVPIPKNLNKKSLEDIENDKKQRRQATTEAIRREYEQNQKQRFNLATEVRPSATYIEKVKEEVEKEIVSGLKFDDFKPRPMPDFSKNQADVKLTVAALKREKHLIDKEERGNAERLAQMEMGLKDASEFIRWQREMEQKDDIEKIEHVQKKKIEMELSREHAIAAQERKVHENHNLASKVKKEVEKLLEDREHALAEDLKDNKVVIEAIHNQHVKAADAVKHKHDENRELRDKINKDLEEAAKRLKDEQAAEHARKEELIRQIREIEKIPIQRTQGFDPTEAGNHGLMIEMSVAELRERLELNKMKLQQEVEFKRDQNLAKKEREALTLVEDASKIEEARKKRKLAADQRREQQEKDAEIREQAKIAAREKGLKEAYDKISSKKKTKAEEDARLAKELKEIKLQRQYMNANAAMVEYKQWEGLEAGKERMIRDGQNLKLIEQCGANEIKVSDQLVRATNAKNEVTQKITYDRGFADRLLTQKKENEVLHKKTLEYKQNMHEKQRNFEQDLKETQVKQKPFNSKINQMSLANATAHKMKLQANQDTMEFIIDGNAGGEYDFESQRSGFNLMDGEGAADDIEAKMRLEAS